MQAMGATKAAVLDALKDSELETNENEDGEAWLRRKGGAKLPTLEDKGKGKGKRKHNAQYSGNQTIPDPPLTATYPPCKHCGKTNHTAQQGLPRETSVNSRRQEERLW